MQKCISLSIVLTVMASTIFALNELAANLQYFQFDKPIKRLGLGVKGLPYTISPVPTLKTKPINCRNCGAAPKAKRSDCEYCGTPR